MWLFMMIYFMAIMVLHPVLDCWGNRCRRPLRCLHHFPPICVWPSGEVVAWFFGHDVVGLVLHVSFSQNRTVMLFPLRLRPFKFAYKPQPILGSELHFIAGSFPLSSSVLSLQRPRMSWFLVFGPFGRFAKCVGHSAERGFRDYVHVDERGRYSSPVLF